MSVHDVPRDPSLADPLPEDPLGLFGRWLDEARASGSEEAAVMYLSTLADGRPAARAVLWRGYDAARGYVVFHTNRQSHKGRELAAQPLAAGLFNWFQSHRQVRVQGPVDWLPDAESDAYWSGRPRPAQIAAAASRQSEPIASRAALLELLEETERRYAGLESIPRPPHWGGYRLWIESLELWAGAVGRAHDRALWVRSFERVADGFAGGAWKASRLQP